MFDKLGEFVYDCVDLEDKDGEYLGVYNVNDCVYIG